MKIIFLGHNPLQAALIAANLYLGKGPTQKLPEGLNTVPYQDMLFSPIYIGSDNKGNQVYTLGGGKDLWMVKRSIEDLLNILGIEEGNLMVAPVSTSWDRVLGWFFLFRCHL
jgi:hypothetical protein